MGGTESESEDTGRNMTVGGRCWRKDEESRAREDEEREGGRGGGPRWSVPGPLPLGPLPNYTSILTPNKRWLNAGVNAGKGYGEARNNLPRH